MSYSMPNTSSGPVAGMVPPMARTGSHETLVYRSRAVHPMSQAELHELALLAQSRNRLEAITGMVLYDQGSFFQWLEGPAEGLERVATSIQHDARHTDIRILDRHTARSRTFGGWNMKLAATGQNLGRSNEDVIQPPPGLVAELRRDPDAAPRVLEALRQRTSAPFARRAGSPRSGAPGLLNRHTASLLKTVITEALIPALAGQHGAPRLLARSVPAHGRVMELADLLIAGDELGLSDLIREVESASPQTLLPFATLFEPTARRLGDLWAEDFCTEFDVTLSLARLQTAARLLGANTARRAPEGTVIPNVLITPEPGEPHGLGAALDSEALWNVGWHPHCEYPQTDRDLAALLAGEWFDVLDMSLSAAFLRQGWLPRLRTSIAAARDASRNPDLLVVVGGRIFAEHLATTEHSGADIGSTSSLNIDRSILSALVH